MKRLFLLFLASFMLFSTVLGQYRRKTQKNDFFNNSHLRKPMYRWVTGSYKRLGFQVSVGPTYTFTSLVPQKGQTQLQTTNSTAKYSIDPKSRLGAFIEVGMTHIITKPNKFIHYFDWGIGFKVFRGGEYSTTKIYNPVGVKVNSLKGHGEFQNNYFFGRFDAHNVFQINPYLFLDNSLGVNIDIATKVGNQNYDGYRPPIEQHFQGNIIGQLHYSLGLGIRPVVERGFYFVPSVEVPFLGVYEWNGGTPAIQWFSSYYMPVILRLKFVWLFRKDPNACPPVGTNSKDSQKAQKFQQHK